MGAVGVEREAVKRHSEEDEAQGTPKVCRYVYTYSMRVDTGACPHPFYSPSIALMPWDESHCMPDMAGCCVQPLHINVSSAFHTTSWSCQTDKPMAWQHHFQWLIAHASSLLMAHCPPSRLWPAPWVCYVHIHLHPKLTCLVYL